MSHQAYNSKFPGQTTGLPPSPAIENPGRVFPPNDPKLGSFVSPNRITTSERYVGNPFLMNNALDKLDHAFGEVIVILEQEDNSQSRNIAANPLLSKLRSWRNELERVRLGDEEFPDTLVHAQTKKNRQEGGMFTD